MTSSKKGDSCKVKILRSNPGAGEDPQFENYQVPYVEKSSVLNVLTHIADEIDPSLAFYQSCRIGKCMGCQVRVNGKAKMACTTPAQIDMTIEPLKGFRTIKDLVVNRKKEPGKK